MKFIKLKVCDSQVGLGFPHVQNELDGDNQASKRFQGNSSSDLISNLSSNVIDNILIYLSIHEAVGTSILSKRWRFRWSYITSLWTHIEFYLLCSLPSSFPEICLLFLYLRDEDIHEIDFSYGFNRIPSHLFSCFTLRRLTLSKCHIKVPLAFQGFVKLISLKFRQVYFDTDDIFESFISKWPLLETLWINNCSEIDSLEIDLPYLKYFEFCGDCRTFSFRNVSQHLSTYYFEGCYKMSCCEPTKLFESLPVVKHLYLGYDFLQYMCGGSISMKLSLGCLRVLKLHEVHFQRTRLVSVLLCLIVSSPNLEELEIGAESVTIGFIVPHRSTIFKCKRSFR
ncbi:F-box/FBD/LRR-repeat protein At1g13570-like [Mercurialis annua]|uniref:F-box/FBD/LRR-repeat protein At1g13570-like n=1 Tax=Mercurialis annua TaxID=3986 RepID=UPI00215E45B1|nr:F-box/FBD/LRR-repeat protein At1g13570-like [Mercurialis annua]